MRRRHTGIPTRWLIVAELDRDAVGAVRALPRGSGLLLLSPPSRNAPLFRAVRRAGQSKDMPIVAEGVRVAARVHDIRELRSALLRRTRLMLLSPIYPTASHPDWRPLPRMQAAALARLAGGRLIALGGMNERRFKQVQRLGFRGWAGMSAWLRKSSRK